MDADPVTPAEPPRLYLRPGTPVLVRSDGSVQCGSDPRWALVLDGLTAAEASWIRDLAERRHVAPEQSATRRGVVPERRARIQEVLTRAGLLVPPAPAAQRVTAPDRGAADARTLGTVRPDGAGLTTLAGRARATVGIVGLGRIGAALGHLLATAGVGGLVLSDPRPVQTTDIGPGGYTPHHVGSPREVALAEILGAGAPMTTIQVNGSTGPDIAVVIESRATLPARYTRLMNTGCPHLSIVVGEADAVVGPLVRPGISPCVTCVEADAADHDRDWYLVAAQLRQGPEQLQESVLAAQTAATAAGQVLAQVDGHRPTTVGGYLRIALPDCLPQLRRVDAHRRCGCLTLAP